MIIRAANHEEYSGIMQFYYDLIDSMQDTEFKPAWKKDVYPTREFIQTSIERRELFIADIDSNIVGVFALNNEYADGYDKVRWKVNADKSEVLVIHALGISSLYQGQGIAKNIVKYIIKKEQESGMKAIRLDVLSSNKPAHKLYVATGFTYIDTIQLFYEDTGLTDFMLYELLL